MSGKIYSLMDSKNKQCEKEKGQNITVVVRCRPRNDMEQNMNSPNVVDLNFDRKEVLVSSDNVSGAHFNLNRTFYFDRVFDQRSKQIDVYKSVVCPLIDEVLQGYSCTVFAYGQTGTGKTYTMEGCRTSDRYCYSWDQDPKSGMIPRSIHQLFEMLNRNQNISEFSVRVSFLEIYNEELFDLLGPAFENQKLRIYDDAARKGSVFVQGLEELIVHNKSEVYTILERGAQRRQTAATLLNAHSSRSHTVFSITVNMKESNIHGEDILKTGRLYLVDLAGSENIGRSGALERRAREAGTINQSLLTLGRVISALVEKTPHIPYRESKLTRLLQDSLGGRTKTCIIATISPSAYNIDETLSTLEYAQRAKHIQNRPEVNQLNKKGLIKEYTEQIEKLKKDLVASRDKNGIFLSEDTYGNLQNTLTSQKDVIIELEDQLSAHREQVEKLNNLFETNKQTIEEQQEELLDAKDWLLWVKEELHNARQRINQKSRQIMERDAISNELVKDQNTIYEEATNLLKIAREDIKNIDVLHSKISQLRNTSRKNQDHVVNFGKILKNGIKSLLTDISALKALQKQTKDDLETVASQFIENSKSTLTVFLNWLDSFINQSLETTSSSISEFDAFKRKLGAFSESSHDSIEQNKQKVFKSFETIVSDHVLPCIDTASNLVKSSSLKIQESKKNNTANIAEFGKKIAENVEKTKLQTTRSEKENDQILFEPNIKEIKVSSENIKNMVPLLRESILSSFNSIINDSFSNFINHVNTSNEKIANLSDSASNSFNLKVSNFKKIISEQSNSQDVLLNNIHEFSLSLESSDLACVQDMMKMHENFSIIVSTFSEKLNQLRGSFIDSLNSSTSSFSGSVKEFSSNFMEILDSQQNSLIVLMDLIKSSRENIASSFSNLSDTSSKTITNMTLLSDLIDKNVSQNSENTKSQLSSLLTSYKEEMNKCRFNLKSVGDTPTAAMASEIHTPTFPKKREELAANAHIMIDSNVTNTPTPPRSRIMMSHLKTVNKEVNIPKFPSEILNNEEKKTSLLVKENQRDSTEALKKP